MGKKQRDNGDGGSDWLNTYADMVTLLLTFFAVLLSMSTVDEMKLNAFIRSFSNLPQEVIEEITSSNSQSSSGEEQVVNTDIDDLYEMLQEYIEQNNQSEMVQVFKMDDVLYIRFSSSLFFEPDQYVLRTGSLPVLNFIGDGLKNFESGIKMVNVLGFTATVQNGTYWMLSGERAAVVATYFNNTSGFDPLKLTVIGYGNRFPVAPNDTEEGRKQNRRVELMVVGNNSAEDFNISNALENLYGPNGGATISGGNSQVEEDQLPPSAIEPPISTEPIETDVSPYEE